MMKISLVLAISIAVTLMCLSVGATRLPGKCEEVSVQQGFDASRYLGVWYEVARFDYFFEENGVCSTANYTLKADGKVRVLNKERYKTPDGELRSAEGEAYAPDPSQPAKLLVTFQKPFYSPYYVIETDYTGYSLVFSCTSILGWQHFDFAWILSRNPTLDQAVVDRLVAKLKSFDVDVSKFKFGIQDGCWK